MKSTTNQRREHVDYNSVAIFIRLAVLLPAKSREILRKLELIAVQGHPRSSMKSTFNMPQFSR